MEHEKMKRHKKNKNKQGKGNEKPHSGVGELNYEITIMYSRSSLLIGTVIHMLQAVLEIVPIEKIAVHFHGTYGRSLPNILVSLQMGISIVDSSVAGLGGCPYAKGALGNVATEDVVYLINGFGIKTNVDLTKHLQTDEFISKLFNIPLGVSTSLLVEDIGKNSSKILGRSGGE